MNRILFVCLILALCIISASAAPPLVQCKHNPPNPFMVDLPSGFVSSIQAFLPEGKAISSSLISTKAWDPNFFFDFTDTPGFTEAYVNVTFLWEGAGYRNQFGYFTYTVSGNKYKVVKEVILFDDVSFPDSGSDYKNNPACLVSGVSTTFGPFKQGERVGWFCYPDRVRTNSKTTLYSEDALNANEATGEVHVIVASLQGQYIVGFEDIAPLKNSDRDYNDIVFIASTTKAGKITVPPIPADCKDPYCNGRGSCNKTTLVCDCATTSSTSYFSGDACEVPHTCTPSCGAGICTAAGCVCDKTRFSADCTACATGRYVFPTCDPCPKTCKNGCNADGTCYIPPPPPPPNPPPTCLSKPFLAASDYQVFVSGDFTGVNSDITTRLAAAGSVTLTQYSLGEALATDENFNCNSFGASDNKNTLVVGGNLNFDSGNVRVGNIIYGGVPTIGAGVLSSLSVGCVSAQGTNAVDFTNTLTWLNGLSRTFKSYSNNGQVYFDSANKDKLVFQAPTTAPSKNIYVWSVSPTDLANAKFVTFLNVPTTAAILVINVPSTKGAFTFADASFDDVLNSGLSSRIVWNFYDARSINIQRIGLAGIILAPFAAVTGSDSVIWGNIYAASFSGSTQVNEALETIQPCILSDIKIVVDDGSCPPCLDGATAGSGCKCTCPSLKCSSPYVADPAGSCSCVCNANPNCPLGVDAKCNCIVAAAPKLGAQCRQSPFSWLTDFQVVTQGGTTISSAYIGGRSAAGGALSLTRVSLGLDLVKTSTDDCSVSGYSYVAAGAASVVAGNVVGNIAHGSSCQFSYSIAIPPFPRPAYCEFPLYSPSLFQSGGKFSISDAFGNYVISISAQLADPNTVPTTGVYVMSNDIMTLYGANSAFEVFSVSATDLANTRRVDVRGLGNAQTVLINIVGSTSVTISKCGLQSLLPFSRLLLWNAPSATSFKVANVALPGYILAPSAGISNPVGQIVGGVFASSFAAKGNIYLPWLGSFAGCVPVDLVAKSCAACPAGSARLGTSCDCSPLVTISSVVTSDFGFGTGYSVKYTVNNAHSKPLSAITVTFPQDPNCPLKVGADNANQVYALNLVAGTSAQYTTPSWVGFSANSYSFIALYYSAAGTCNPKTPYVPSINAVTF